MMNTTPWNQLSFNFNWFIPYYYKRSIGYHWDNRWSGIIKNTMKLPWERWLILRYSYQEEFLLLATYLPMYLFICPFTNYTYVASLFFIKRVSYGFTSRHISVALSNYLYWRLSSSVYQFVCLPSRWQGLWKQLFILKKKIVSKY